MPNSKVLKAGIGYTIGNYLLKGLSFLTVPIFARILSVEDFGIYSTFVAYETILFVILGCAIHTSYKNAKYKYDIEDINNGRQSEYSYHGYVSASFCLIAVNTVVLLILSFLFSDRLSSILGLNRFSITLLVLYSFSTEIITCYNTDASLRYSYKSYLLVSGINAVLNIFLSILLILTCFKSQRYMGRILGTVLPIFTISFCICLVFWRREKPSHIAEYLKWGLPFSFPIVFHGLSQVLLSQFDRIMIRNMNGNAAVGLYSFGYTVFSIINVTFNSTDSVWSTWFYEKLNKKETIIIKEYSSYYIYFILTLCVSLMIVCPEVIDLFGSYKYHESRYCTIPIIASGFYVFLYTLPSGVEYYYEKTKRIAFATMTAAFINVVLNAIFIKKYGYIAAAYTTLFTYFLYFIFHYLQAKKICGENLFPVPTIIISSIIIVVFIILSYLLLEHPMIRWTIAIIIFGLYLLYEERTLKVVGNIIKQWKKKREY